jgi:hypothetical protein
MQFNGVEIGMVVPESVFGVPIKILSIEECHGALHRIGEWQCHPPQNINPTGDLSAKSGGELI